ncbi:hypothetical protein BpHYR1_050342 [Brachionus plicatilis]|uniref:Uncharacterized protein n=1 Tax=Brachionus plicatilis TaxID=10195 RepID=A0A3M7PMV7_BRAPC|nr:hypothetical protein BpHYR1_050342 [Brachionus plicatilis]
MLSLLPEMKTQHARIAPIAPIKQTFMLLKSFEFSKSRSLTKFWISLNRKLSIKNILKNKF